MTNDPKHVARAYIAYTEALRSAEDDDFTRGDEYEWAYDELWSAFRHGPPDRAWELTRAILDESADEDLDMYSAGPLEDCVRRHGAALVERIEREAAFDERLRWCLGCVWLGVSDLPDDTLRRLHRASDGELKVFGWPGMPPDPEAGDDV